MICKHEWVLLDSDKQGEGSESRGYFTKFYNVFFCDKCLEHKGFRMKVFYEEVNQNGI